MIAFGKAPCCECVEGMLCAVGLGEKTAPEGVNEEQGEGEEDDGEAEEGEGFSGGGDFCSGVAKPPVNHPVGFAVTPP